MKIMFVANVAWDTYIFRGGVIKDFIAQGHEVIVVAPDTGRVDIEKELGAKYIEISINKRGVNPVEDMKLLFTLRKLYKQEKPDIIFHYTIKPNIFGTLAAKLAGCPSVAVLTGLGYSFVNGGMVSKIAKALYKFSLHFSKEIWVLNEDDCLLLKELNIVQENKLFVLPGEGINTESFKPTVTQNKKDQLIFLMIARAFFDKGFREYEAAARKIKSEYGDKVLFQFLGDPGGHSVAGVTKEHLKSLDEEGILSYLGHKKDILSIINAADCIVLPSYREGISRVLLEAGAMEKPAITTLVAGCRDIVQNGINGFLVPPKDAESLAEKMKMFISLSEDERRNMGLKGRDIILEKFDEKIVIEIYRKKLKELIGHEA